MVMPTFGAIPFSDIWRYADEKEEGKPPLNNQQLIGI